MINKLGKLSSGAFGAGGLRRRKMVQEQSALFSRFREHQGALELGGKFVPDETEAAQVRRNNQRFEKSDLPAHEVIVLFTPRSGSGWLADILGQAGLAPKAGEPFNPGILPRVARKIGATDLDSYIERQRRLKSFDGIYAAKVTPKHALIVFGGVESFLDRFRSAGILVLVRENILKQAVSLYLMRFQKVSHAIDGGAIEHSHAPVYNSHAIHNALTKLLDQERLAHEALLKTGRPALWIGQERMLRSDKSALLARISDHLGLPCVADVSIAERHGKVGTSVNDDYAARFAAESAELLARVAKERSAWLERLLPPFVGSAS